MARGFRSIRDDPIAFLGRAQARYGDLVAFPVPGPPALLLNDPADVRHVLVSRAGSWTKHTVQYAALARVTGPGLLAVADEGWLPRRRIAQPAFHHARLERVVEDMRLAARRVVDGIGSGPPVGANGPALDTPPGLTGRAGAGVLVDVSGLALALTLDVVGHTLFDRDLLPAAGRLVSATDAAAELVVAQGRAVVPLPSWLPTPSARRMRAAVSELDAVCREVIGERRRRGVEDSDSDLLGLLVAAGLPDGAVRDELVTMVVAGHETVASALTWTLLLLAQHPQEQDRLREELRDAGSADMAALPFTVAVIHEALRLYPPGWVISRRAREPDVLSGHPVPSGTLAIISPWLLHRRPSSWPDALRFAPERFLDAATTARADYIPFGLGPRLCIGRDFALMELTVVLAELLREHRVALALGQPGTPELDAFVTLRPRGGLRLLFSPVTKADEPVHSPQGV